MSDSQLQCNEGANVKGVLILEHRRKGELLMLRTISNLETDAYKALRANLRKGAGVAPSIIAIGKGETAATVDDDEMETEVDSQAADTTRITTTVENDTSQYTYTFTLAEDTDITEAGLLNTGDVLCYHRVFDVVPCLEDDTLRVTWRSQST